MSSDSTENELQFGKAEFEGQHESASAACFACQAALNEDYFDINGSPACTSCKSSIVSSFNAGSGSGRMLRALLFGLVAAVLGASIYFAIVKLTGYEIGLVSILVGYMVGKAVFIGSRHRGGAAYQTLAIALTYLAIVATYVPFVWSGLEAAEDAAYIQQDRLDSGSPADAATEAFSAEGDRASASEPGTLTRDGSTVATTETQSNWADMAVAMTMLLGLILAMPFLAGLENVIGLLIIGFGLYQAWSLNRKAVFNISGPFRVKPEPA